MMRTRKFTIGSTVIALTGVVHQDLATHDPAQPTRFRPSLDHDHLHPVCAENAGAAALIADRNWIRAWKEVDLIPL